MSVQRRVFPESFKREAVDTVASSGLSANAVAKELRLHQVEFAAGTRRSTDTSPLYDPRYGRP